MAFHDLRIDENNIITEELSAYVKMLAKLQWDDDKGRFKKNPVLHLNYNLNSDHFNEMSVHVSGSFPDKLLNDYRPNETENIRKYRMGAYQCITKTESARAINVLNRIFAGGNYAVRYGNDDEVLNERTLRQYVEQDFPMHENLYGYFQQVVTPSGTEDPNAIIGWRPDCVCPHEDELFHPVPFIYFSPQVIDYEIGEYYTLLSQEKTWVEYGHGKELSGKIFEIYTRNQIIHVRQIGKKNDNLYEVTVFYIHDLNYVPCFILGGIVNIKTFPMTYRSFLSPALPHWNKAIREDSDRDASMVQGAYLQKWEKEIICKDCNGTGYGRELLEGKPQVCTSCNGRGQNSLAGPYKATVIPQQENNDVTEKLEAPPAGYITIPTEIIGIQEDSIKNHLQRGRAALFMDWTVDTANGAETATGRLLDREDLYSMLIGFCNNMFDRLLIPSLWVINNMRYQERAKDTSVTKP